MREFSATVTIDAGAEMAFDFVADYHNVPAVLEGVTRWQPLGRRRTGVGARFEVEMRTLGFPMGNVLVLDAWERPRRIGWHSESGLVEQRGGWRFEAGPGGVEVTLTIAYQPPGAAIGNLIASRADGIVRRRLEKALAAMRERLEAGSD